MGGVLVLGLLVGMRHALEADHVAAVAALTQRSRGFRSALRLGAAWGIGHTLTLFAAGTIVLSLDGVMPEQIARIFEFAVGIMLVLLGADLLRRLIVARVHVHIHRHGDGTTHFHAHSHAGEANHTSSRHDHMHVRGLPARALAVGLMHGLAGSAALILLTVGQIDSFFWAMAYLALFGIGSMIGMAALSVVIAIPLQRVARSLSWAHNALGAAIGLGTIGLGAWVSYRIGVVEGLTLTGLAS